MKKAIATSLLAVGLLAGNAAYAEDYTIDTEGMHAFVQFRIKHLGYSWLYGRFNDFNGTFSYDQAKPEDAKVEVTIKTDSVDTNHAERNKHLRSDDFLDVEKFPEAKFVSTKYTPGADGAGKLEGNLTLHGVTKPVSIDVKEIGAGEDPWGGFRRGFEGSTVLTLKDFDIKKDLGPASQELEMMLSIEGVRK
ncbi:MAG: YceI family protein [Gammaproteobacteria bacterium]|nr:YceI family protein [Gammaproteobacteria bacterium]MBU1725893.1 YceI family protein [Gammaproteobacteria bacterium]MBU2006401.1 YceI family protein [Gammaproteobacteria bacterium]